MSGTVDGLRASRETFARRLAAMDELIAQAARQVYHGESTDRAVLASVDGNGRLLGLRVDPEALRTAHPQRVGPQVVRAVTAAREEAATAKARRIQETFGPRDGR